MLAKQRVGNIIGSYSYLTYIYVLVGTITQAYSIVMLNARDQKKKYDFKNMPDI